MTTTADERIEAAKAALNRAIDSLSEVVVNRCPGHEDYKAVYKQKLARVFNSLLSLREDLES